MLKIADEWSFAARFSEGDIPLKLTITLPALNEAATVGDVVRKIPREIPGIDEIEAIVIDDGSTDDTAELAREARAIVVSNGV